MAALTSLLARRVGAEGARLAAGVLDLGGDRSRGLLVDVRRHHLRAFAAEHSGDGPADAGAGAGDERGLACEASF